MKQPVQTTAQLGTAIDLSGNRAALVLNILHTAPTLPGGIELFKYDCEILQHIPSDSIVPIVELIELDGRLLVMSRDTGVVPLRDILRRYGTLSAKNAIFIATGVVQALRDIHARNAVYKTLCPTTVCVSPDLAKVQLGPPLLPFIPGDTALDGASVSPMLAYLSPEQYARAVYTHEYRSDFYSLGLVLLEMLTGVPPTPRREGDSRQPYTEEQMAEVPLCLRSVLELLLAADPGYRYQSTAGLLHDLAVCARLLPDDQIFVAGTLDRSSRYVFPSAMYGQDEEIRLLREAATRVASGAGAEIALITGESGMGKSALVWHTFGERLEFSHIITVELQPDDSADESSAPERLIEELQSRYEMPEVVSEYRSAHESTDDELRLTRALARAATAPVAIIIDNLHYAHPRFVDALALAVQNNARRPLLLLATVDNHLATSDPVNCLKSVVRDTVPVRTLSPSPLGLLYIRQIIVDTFGESLEDTLVLAELVMRRTEGNPRAVRSYIDNLVGIGVLYFAYGRWQCDVHKLRGSHSSDDVTDVLSSMSKDIPYRVFDELVSALAVDDIVDRVTVRELKKEIRAYRRQTRRNKDFVEEVQKFMSRIAGLMPEFLFLFDIVHWQGVYANHDIRSLLGYKDTVDDTVASIIALIHPDDRTTVLGAIEHLRRVSDREVLNKEFRLKAADGSWQWFAAWITVFNRNADGEVQCLFGLARNITPRKETQAALAESEKRLSTIYNSVSDAILLIAVEPGNGDRRYVVATVNQAFLRLASMEPDQLVGQELQDVFGQPVVAQFVRNCTRAIEQRQPVYYEQEIALARGPRMFDTTLTPIFDDDNGHCSHILMSGHDITKRIRAEKRILAKYRENRQLVKKINEQSSALMNAIVRTQEEERRRIALDLHDGLAQMLSVARMNFSSFELQADTLDSGQQELLHTSIELLDTALRELSLVSYNLMPNTLYDFGLIPALEDMFHMINRVSAVKLAFHTHDYRRLDHQTEIILYRVIQELVNNAFRHSGASEISVQLIMHYRRLVIVVDDNGRGFAVDDIRNDEKSGIGLKSVETRVQYLDGSMSVDSHANSGTIVAVEIPLVPASFAEETEE